MPSSTSSSELLRGGAGRVSVDTADRYARQTAADRPGVAQPVPVRPVPAQPWGKILVAVAMLLVLMLAGWEAYYRAYGVTPSISNTYGLWAIQRRRIDAGEGDATVLLGASRVFFDIQLPVWERLDGRRPIQLSFEGTSPLRAVEDLAADPKFTGRILIGVAPDLFFSGYEYRAGAIRYARQETPSQRIGQWLSMHLIEPYLAFDDSDYALQTVLDRQAWPDRPGLKSHIRVRKLAMVEADRNTHLWDKVDTDPEYRALARRVWMQNFAPSEEDDTLEQARKTAQEQIERMAKAVAKLKARGVKVLFVRPPSAGPYLEFERREIPRAQTWDPLLAACKAPGIHFEDYPELQGYRLPEWSHVAHAQADQFTTALYGIIQRKFWGPGVAAPAPPAPASR